MATQLYNLGLRHGLKGEVDMKELNSLWKSFGVFKNKTFWNNIENQNLADYAYFSGYNNGLFWKR